MQRIGTDRDGQCLRGRARNLTCQAPVSFESNQHTKNKIQQARTLEGSKINRQKERYICCPGKRRFNGAKKTSFK